jgi:hypothetical protein
MDDHSEQPLPPQLRTGFVAMMRTSDTLELIEEAPLAFTLAAVISLRAKWSSGPSIKGLSRGEAFIGDWRRCGLSEQQYRTAKKQLANWGYATFRATNRGTVARLCDTRLFDPLALACNGLANEPSNEPVNTMATDSQRLTNTGKQRAKNKQGEEEADGLPPEVVAWNQSPGLTAVRTWTASRARLLSARRRDSFFAENWRTAIAKIAASKFCTGVNDRGWRADIDWFLRPTTVGRIMEGKYDDRSPASKPAVFASADNPLSQFVVKPETEDRQ